MAQKKHQVRPDSAADRARQRFDRQTRKIFSARPRSRALDQPIARDREELELKRAVRQTARLSDLARKLKRAIRGADTVLSGLSTLLVEREVRRMATIATDEAPRG